MARETTKSIIENVSPQSGVRKALVTTNNQQVFKEDHRNFSAETSSEFELMNADPDNREKSIGRRCYHKEN